MKGKTEEKRLEIVCKLGGSLHTDCDRVRAVKSTEAAEHCSLYTVYTPLAMLVHSLGVQF